MDAGAVRVHQAAARREVAGPVLRHRGPDLRDPAADLVRVKAAATSLSEPVETFTIDINDIRNDSATLNFIWEKTRVQVNLSIEKTAMQK